MIQYRKAERGLLLKENTFKVQKVRKAASATRLTETKDGREEVATMLLICCKAPIQRHLSLAAAMMEIKSGLTRTDAVTEMRGIVLILVEQQLSDVQRFSRIMHKTGQLREQMSTLAVVSLQQAFCSHVLLTKNAKRPEGEFEATVQQSCNDFDA